MLTAYGFKDNRLEPIGGAALGSAVWIDLLTPAPEESRAVEAVVGIGIPTLEDMEEIELSSRLYEEDGARVMTMTALFGLDTDAPTRTPLTFIIKDRTLVTIRYAELKTFTGYAARATRSKTGPCGAGGLVMLGLLEAVIDRIADALEKIAAEIDALSREVFRHPVARSRRLTRDLEALIGRIGRQGDLLTMLQESIVSVSRVVTYFAATDGIEEKPGRETRQGVQLIQRDAASLGEHATFLSEKISFLLDATLGLITLEQNKIIKIFSIVSVVFMPPTLVASIYGMNFERMPELGWTFGYPFALLLMVLFAILPFLFFKGKGWL